MKKKKKRLYSLVVCPVVRKDFAEVAGLVIDCSECDEEWGLCEYVMV